MSPGDPSRPTPLARTVLTMDAIAPTEISMPPPRITIASPTAMRIMRKNTRMLLLSVSRANMFGCTIRLMTTDNTSRIRANRAGWRPVKDSHLDCLIRLLHDALLRQGWQQLDSL